MTNYNSTWPADNEFIKNLPGAIREKGRQLKEDRIVDAGLLQGQPASNFAAGDGTVNLEFKIGKGNNSPSAIEVILSMVAGAAAVGKIVRGTDGKYRFYASGTTLADIVAASFNGKLINHDSHEQGTDEGTTKQNFVLDKGNAAGAERNVMLKFERGASAAQDAALMWDATAGGFKLLALASGALANIDVLTINGYTIKHNSHAQNTDTGTSSQTFTLGSGSDPTATNMGLQLGGVNGPYLRWVPASGEWQLYSAWNGGTNPDFGALNCGGLYVRGRSVRVPVIIDDTLVTTTSTNYQKVKSFRLYRSLISGMAPRFLRIIAGIGGLNATGTTYCLFRYGGVETSRTLSSQNSEVMYNATLDISGLDNGMYEFEVQLRTSTSSRTARQKYLEVSAEY